MKTSYIKMKPLLLASVLILSLGATACGNANTETSVDPSNVTTVMDEGTSITEVAGSNVSELQISDIPDDYKTQAESKGKVVRLDYDTSNGSKYAYIYLPHGYSENEQYDILYLMHGGGGSAESVFGSPGSNSEMKNVVDRLIENGELKPMLIVTPTFYTSKNNSSSVNGSWDAVREFPDELTNELMPAVESTYSTFAETVDETGFTASREHRAFGGFSMGAVTTWYVFEGNLSYFHGFIPISGDSWTVEMQGGRSKRRKLQPGLHSLYLNRIIRKMIFTFMRSPGVKISRSR